MIVEYGQLTNSFHTKAVIIRDEKVYESPVEGKITYFAKNSHRISGGQVIAKINSSNENVPIHSREAGILSFSYDKLENELNPENMSKISIQKFNNIKNNYQQINDDIISKGKPFFRIVNNSNLYSMVTINNNKVENYWINETVFIRDKDLEKSDLYEAKIKDIIKYDEKSVIILEFKRFIDKWLNKRKIDIEFIKNIYEGLVIPDSAVLPTSDGYKVVLVDASNNYNLKNIETEFNDGEYLIIKGLEIGDKILINPTQSNYDVD